MFTRARGQNLMMSRKCGDMFSYEVGAPSLPCSSGFVFLLLMKPEV